MSENDENVTEQSNEQLPTHTIENKSATIELDKPIYQEATAESAKQVPIDVIIAPDSETYSQMTAKAKSEAGTSKKGLEWFISVGRAEDSALTQTSYGSVSFGDPNVVFKQRIKSADGTFVGLKKPKVGKVDGDGKLNGAGGVQRVRNLLGTGGTVRIPLYASGFWITLTTPDENTLLNLDNNIQMEKSQVGANTLGLALSVSTVYILKHVMNLILDSIHVHNIVDDNFTNAKLSQYIKITDILPLVHLMAGLIYPNGYVFKLPCTAEGNCVNVDEQLLNINDLIYTNTSNLSAEQIEWMASPSKPRSIADIKAYQDKFHQRHHHILEDNGGVTINLRIPSAYEYIDSGEKWINEVIAVVDRTIAEGTDLRRKERMIQDTYNLATCREYAHCIESIVFPPENEGEEAGKVDDPITLQNILAEFSKVPDLALSIVKNIRNYLDTRSYYHSGLPKHTCSECGKKDEGEDPLRPKYAVPIDPVTTFFTVRDRKLQRVTRD